MTPRPSLAASASAALLLLAVGCSSTHHSYDPPAGALIAQHSRPAGGQATYQLVQRQAGKATIHRTIDATRDVGYLGLRMANVDANLATALGVVAWNGVYIETVIAGSPAAEAGLVSGDILRSIDGEDIGSQDEAREVIDGQLAPGVAVEVLVQRWTPSGDDLMLAGHRVMVTPGSRSVDHTVKESFELELADGVKALTGLAVALVPNSLAHEIWGASRPVLAIASVTTGSPAYHAGFRAGDRLVAVDGVEPSSLTDIERPIAERAMALDVDLAVTRVAGTDSWLGGPLQPRDDDPVLDVTGPLGPHTARLGIDPELDDDGEVYIPILLDWKADVRSTDWEFLDFIFQFGASYRGRYLHSKTRKSVHTTDFSMLPFGMFEYESRPGHSEYTLLWFITIG